MAPGPAQTDPPSDSGDGHPEGVPVARPDPLGHAPDEILARVLVRSRDLGFLGPGPIDTHVRHAAAFLPGIDEVSGGDPSGPTAATGRTLTLVDLGSGGGLPGLVLASLRPELRLVLLDAMKKRTDFLEWAVGELDVADRVTVQRGRAEELARRPDLRASADVVTARSFGPPAVTAECAVGFLGGPGSRLLVSEPPTGTDERWPTEPLSELGLRPGTVWSVPGATVRALEVVAMCPGRFPRRTGLPARRPLF